MFQKLKKKRKKYKIARGTTDPGYHTDRHIEFRKYKFAFFSKLNCHHNQTLLKRYRTLKYCRWTFSYKVTSVTLVLCKNFPELISSSGKLFQLSETENPANALLFTTSVTHH